jgi:outer membrane murein-binding lipoprotein Lpp
MFSMALLLALGVSSYWTGAKLAVSEVTRLERKVEELEKDAAELRDRNVALQTEAATALDSQSKWQARYKAEVPTGKSRERAAGPDRKADRQRRGPGARRLSGRNRGRCTVLRRRSADQAVPAAHAPVCRRERFGELRQQRHHRHRRRVAGQ